MLIYIFAEHYPNPYKPQFDTEHAFFIRQGHDIRIFAGGKFTSTIHPRVKKYGLDKKTRLFPTTLKTLPNFLGILMFKILGSPILSIQRMRAIFDNRYSMKVNILRFARMLLLPGNAPDICYIHNIATANCIDFLHNLYPSSRIIMYFHGGEVGGVKKVTRDYQLFKLMDIVLSNTNFSKKQAIERGCPSERAVVLPVGFDLSDYPDSPKKYRPNTLLRLISVGRLSEEKGLLYALESVNRLVKQGHQNIHYTIVGKGSQEHILKEYVKYRNFEHHITFVGEQDKAGVVNFLKQSDVLILPSIETETWAETQAAVVQEAMFMRLLVITTKTGGVPESIADVMQQFSVPVHDSTAIADKVQKILSLPDTVLASLGNEARRFAVEKYNIEAIGIQFFKNITDADQVNKKQDLLEYN